jgi:membrane associated rhomboid family serine protease
MYHFQLVRRIGASGVIYGWMGMRLFTSLFSRHHSKMSNVDYFFLIGTFAHDLSKSPLTLDELSISTFLDGDNVDHAAHFFGAVGGIILALIILLWDQFLSAGWRSWRGEGIRLGERWEVEQTRVERDRERRERSRLLG